MHHVMKNAKPHKRATNAKIIHRWIPTNEFLHQQDRTKRAECPRCMSCIESADHILVCDAPAAKESRDKHLYQTLKELKDIITAHNILHIFETQLCQVLKLRNRQKYQHTCTTTDINTILAKALHNQNIIGWHEFLRGFISKYWIKAYEKTSLNHNKKQPPWKYKITMENMGVFDKWAEIPDIEMGSSHWGSER